MTLELSHFTDQSQKESNKMVASWNESLCGDLVKKWKERYSSSSRIHESLCLWLNTKKAKKSNKSNDGEASATILNNYYPTLTVLLGWQHDPSKFVESNKNLYKWSFTLSVGPLCEGPNSESTLGDDTLNGLTKLESSGGSTDLWLKKTQFTTDSQTGGSTLVDSVSKGEKWGVWIRLSKSGYANDRVGVFAMRQFHYGNILGFIVGEKYIAQSEPGTKIDNLELSTYMEKKFRNHEGQVVTVRNSVRKCIVGGSDCTPLFLGMHYILCETETSSEKKVAPNVELLTDGTVRVIKRIEKSEEIVLSSRLVCPLDTSNFGQRSSGKVSPAVCAERKLLSQYTAAVTVKVENPTNQVVVPVSDTDQNSKTDSDPTSTVAAAMPPKKKPRLFNSMESVLKCIPQEDKRTELIQEVFKLPANERLDYANAYVVKMMNEK